MLLLCIVIQCNIFWSEAMTLNWIYSWTWNDWAGGFGGDMNGFVLWCERDVDCLSCCKSSAFVTVATHSASNGSLFNDLARECKLRARRGDGDVLMTTCPSHWSALGNWLFGATAAGSICDGDVGLVFCTTELTTVVAIVIGCAGAIDTFSTFATIGATVDVGNIDR